MTFHIKHLRPPKGKGGGRHSGLFVTHKNKRAAPRLSAGEFSQVQKSDTEQLSPSEHCHLSSSARRSRLCNTGKIPRHGLSRVACAGAGSWKARQGHAGIPCRECSHTDTAEGLTKAQGHAGGTHGLGHAERTKEDRKKEWGPPRVGNSQRRWSRRAPFPECEGGETARRSRGCPIPGSAQGRVGQGSEQAGIVEAARPEAPGSGDSGEPGLCQGEGGSRARQRAAEGGCARWSQGVSAAAGGTRSRGLPRMPAAIPRQGRGAGGTAGRAGL